MLTEKKREELYKQGYRIIGNHSAVKICGWTKNSLRNRGVCYKNTFYGIKSWRCVQMTPALQHCNFRCWHCWRDIATASREWSGPIDEPAFIVDECLKEHAKILRGFGGNLEVNKKRYSEVDEPLHFAISLTGEPTMYPRMADLITELKNRNITSYLVTNGSYPEIVKTLINGSEPTQFYITLAAPTETMFKKTTNPLTKHAWERFNETLQIMKEMKCRRVLRLTLMKGHNMVEPKLWGKFIKQLEGHYDFVEVKGYINVGYAQYRNTPDNSPTHDEIRDFSIEIAKYANIKLIDQKPESSVCLLMKEDRLDRILDFENLAMKKKSKVTNSPLISISSQPKKCSSSKQKPMQCGNNCSC